MAENPNQKAIELREKLTALSNQKNLMAQEVILQEKSFAHSRERLSYVQGQIDLIDKMLNEEIELNKKTLKDGKAVN